MAVRVFIFFFFLLATANPYILDGEKIENDSKDVSNLDSNSVEEVPENAFSGVYKECFLYFSYACLQRKTLTYLKELGNLAEVSVIGDYVKFIKLNTTTPETNAVTEDVNAVKSTEDLSFMIDKAVDYFFDNHVLKFRALGRDVTVPHTVDEFVGRKRRKGGGGGGGGHGGDDGGKKKMMMMAMMCMKMKFMMMVPAMMGMMGMMSFKGMMFSMMSFMMTKLMLLMKILEKKGGGGGGGGGGGWAGGDGGWASGGGGGGAWMPAGGQQDYGGGGGGGGGGGYDANGQWQSRSSRSAKSEENRIESQLPIITSITPVVRINNKVNDKKPVSLVKHINDELLKIGQETPKSRKKRGIMDVLQNAYMYWMNRMLGYSHNNKVKPNFPKQKIVNGIKYVYHPNRIVQKPKAPKALTSNDINNSEDTKQVIIVQDFNKGEIVDNKSESRTTKKKFEKMKNDINEMVDENPWE